MVSTVIVALPSVDDKVYKISSEKVPHLTMLYLGDETNTMDVPDIVTFVQHAASHLDPFYLTVDYRGTLGDKEADVIFFEDNLWEMPKLKTFRHQLLLNEAIRRAYDSTEQFPEWRPHLTLGYPDAPAREDDSDYPGLHSVRFDRLAVWFGDYEGPEIRLKYEEHAMEVAMSGMTAEERGAMAADEIFHFGVKGMKWGVRKSDSGGGERGKIRRAITKANVATDAGAKIIREGEKKLLFLPMEHRDRAANRTQARMLSTARRVNKDPEFKGKDIKNDTALKSKYFERLKEEAKTIYAEELDISRTEAWGEFLGVDTTAATNQMRFNIAVDKIKHADDDVETLLEMNFITDANGFVTNIVVPDKYLKHELYEDTEYTLYHYGVKGMKWGVRNNADGTVSVDQTRVRKTLRNAKDVTVTQRKAGTFVKTTGGQRQPASVDAVRAQAGRQKAKKSTTDALSNKELKDTIERMRLEQEFKKLDSKVSRKGRSFATRLMSSPAAKQAAEDLLKKAGEPATS